MKICLLNHQYDEIFLAVSKMRNTKFDILDTNSLEFTYTYEFNIYIKDFLETKRKIEADLHIYESAVQAAVRGAKSINTYFNILGVKKGDLFIYDTFLRFANKELPFLVYDHVTEYFLNEDDLYNNLHKFDGIE